MILFDMNANKFHALCAISACFVQNKQFWEGGGAKVTFYRSGCLPYQYFISILLLLSIFGYCLTLLEPALGTLVYLQPLCAYFQDCVCVSSLVVRFRGWS